MKTVRIRVKFWPSQNLGQFKVGWGTIFTQKFPFIHIIYVLDGYAEVNENILTEQDRKEDKI